MQVLFIAIILIGLRRGTMEISSTMKNEMNLNNGHLRKGYTEEIASQDGVDVETFTNVNNLTKAQEMFSSKQKQTAGNCNQSNREDCIKQVNTGTHINIYIDLSSLQLQKGFCVSGRMLVHYDTNTHICCAWVHNKTSMRQACCGGDLIDTDDKICCNGQVQNRSQGSKCCGKFVYNEQTQICCHDAYIHSRCEGYHCCGSNIINPSTHFCSNNISHKHESNYNKGQDKKDKLHKVDVPCQLHENNSQIYSIERNTGYIHTTDTNRHDQRSFEWPYIVLLLTIVCILILIVFASCVKRFISGTKQPTKTVQSTLFHNYRSWRRCDSGRQSEYMLSDITIEPHNEPIRGNPYTKNSCTQTCHEKTSNHRNIYGKPHEHNFNLSTLGATAGISESSDARMVLSQNVLKVKHVEVYCTSFDEIPKLHQKMGLNKDELIGSPVVQYASSEIHDLSEHAVVFLPFVGLADDVKVKSFHSGQGAESVVTSVNVPLKDHFSQDVDTFYTIEDSIVKIRTKSFSGFYCTTIRHRPLSLRCFVFGSYKHFTYPLREVTFIIYLAGDIMQFADYKKTLIENESSEGRKLVKEQNLTLPSGFTEDDKINTSVTPTDNHYGQWIHKPCEGETSPAYEKEQTMTLRSIVQKCQKCGYCHLREDDIAYSIRWCLTNAEGVIPENSFKGDMRIDIIGNVDGVKTPNLLRFEFP